LVKLAYEVHWLEVEMEVLLICLREGVAAKRQQFVCGDIGCGSGIPQARLSGQFFHALG